MPSSLVDPQSPASIHGGRDGSNGHAPQFSSSSSPQPIVAAVRPSAARVVVTPREGVFPLVLLALAVYGVVYTVVAANWVSHSTVLLWSPALGLLVGWLIARVPRFPQSVLHLAACLIGHWFSIWLTSVVAFHASWLLLLGSLRAMLGVVGTTMIVPNSEMVFFFYLSFLSFFLGYFGSWLIYRAHMPWLVALVYCSILLVNLTYLKQDMVPVVALVLGALLLLIAHGHLTNQLLRWTQEGMYTERGWLRAMTWRCTQVAVLLTVAAVLISLVLPVLTQPANGKALWDRVNTAWMNVMNGHVSLQDLSSITEPYQAPTNFFGDQLTIAGSVHLPAGEVLYYTSSAGPRYLEGFTYNHFDGHTWTSTLNLNNAQMEDPNAALPMDVPNATGDQVTVDVTVVQPPETSKHYLFAPAQPASFDVATLIYSDATTGAWTQQSPVISGERYHVVSTVPVADEQSLGGIPLPGKNASSWQSDAIYVKMAGSYSQVPRDLSPRVEQLARQWTAGAPDAYSALKMLESHLSDERTFTYSLDNQPVPGNVDAVDWLLQTRSGYCTYYASAMVVMARLLGIPTRVVNGFSEGHLDQRRNVWSVSGSDAHSWVQAYLPGHGWISFDPTPGYAPHTPAPQPAPSPVATKPPTKPVATPTAPGKVLKPTQNHPIPPSPTISAVHRAAESKNILGALSVLLLLTSLVVFLAAVGTYWWRSLYGNDTPIAGTFWRLCRVAGWLGVGPRAWQTPYEYGRVLSQQFPQHALQLWKLTELFVRERWGLQQPLTDQEHSEEVKHLVPTLRTMLLSRMLKMGRRQSSGGMR